MAAPHFNGYKYRHSDYLQNNGVIRDITVTGGSGTLNVTWEGPNGYSSGPFSNTHTLENLYKGDYIGTVTDENGSTGTVTITITEKGRLYLSVNEILVDSGCLSEIEVVGFRHNQFSFKYELMDTERVVLSTYNGTVGNEIHTFLNLCNQGYILRATETEEYEYRFDGVSISEVTVPANYYYEHETFFPTKTLVTGVCNTDSFFVSDDIFETSGSTIESFIEVYSSDNLPLDEKLIQVSDEIIKSPKSKDGETIDTCSQAAYKITISKQDIVEEFNCDYVKFVLDGNGLLLFEHGDGSEDYNISSECCSSLGFTPELDENNQYVCRWKEVITDPCHDYTITEQTNNEGYTIFIKDSTGELVQKVPSIDCCERENLIAEEYNGGYRCREEVIEPEPTCDDYGLVEIDSQDGYAIFSYNDTTTKYVHSDECCVVNGLVATSVDGQFMCSEPEPECYDYTIYSYSQNGEATFKDSDGNLINRVDSAECCTYFGLTASEVSTGQYACYGEEKISTCSSFKASEVFSLTTGTTIGSKCLEMGDGTIQQTTFKVDGNEHGHHSLISGEPTTSIDSGTGLSCGEPHSPYGTIVNSFIFQGKTVSTPEHHEIRKAFTGYEFDGEVYDIYVMWIYPLTAGADVVDVYITCQDEKLDSGSGSGGDTTDETPTLYEHQLQYGTETDLACDKTTSESATFYLDGSLSSATVVYDNAAGTVPGPEGWYSDGAKVRYWDGSAFPGTATWCGSGV